jgi:AbrB family looped-hinge helix DNA binding protein
MSCGNKMDACFYGSATVGERGQVVIPAEARAELEIKPGDKLLIMKHPVHQGLMMVKLDHLRDFLDEFSRELERIGKESELVEVSE